MNAAFQTTAYELARSAIQSAQRKASFKLTKAFPDGMDDSIVPAIGQAFWLIPEDSKLLDGWIQRSMDNAPKLVDPCQRYPTRLPDVIERTLDKECSARSAN